MHYLAFNMSGEPFGSNQKLRQAIAMAINKDNIITVASEGLGTPAVTFFSQGYGYYDGYDPYPYDVEKAKALLAEAGYPDGLTLRFYYAGSLKELMSQVIQSTWKEIGINVNIEELETAAPEEQAQGRRLRSFAFMPGQRLRGPGQQRPSAVQNRFSSTEPITPTNTSTTSWTKL